MHKVNFQNPPSDLRRGSEQRPYGLESEISSPKTSEAKQEKVGHLREAFVLRRERKLYSILVERVKQEAALLDSEADLISVSISIE